MKELLLARKYPESLIDWSIDKARKIPRKVALLKVKKTTVKNCPICVAKYDPRTPALLPIVAKHYRAMKSHDKYLGECFPKPAMIGYRRQANLRNFLIKSKVPPPQRLHPGRKKNGMTNCERMCTACPYIKYGKEI